MFTHKKIAQIGAYLATQLGDKRINYMRLMKLMYLADRESLARLGEPISYDDMFSLDHGLILSETYDIVKSTKKIAELPAWSEYFSPRRSTSDYFIGVKKKVNREELDRLSDTDIEILDATLATFGGMDEWALSQYMHDNCDEWQFPNGSRISVNEEALLKILGLPPKEAAETAVSIKTERQMNKLFRLP
jgi:hypothetical protein